MSRFFDETMQGLLEAAAIEHERKNSFKYKAKYITEVEMIIFITSWILAGLFGTICLVTHDIRGKEYDAGYFHEYGVSILLMPITGYIALVIALCIFLKEKKVPDKIYKKIHKLANIGVKK